MGVEGEAKKGDGDMETTYLKNESAFDFQYYTFLKTQFIGKLFSKH